MKDLRHPSTSSTIEDRGDKSTGRTAETIPSPTRNVDAATIKKIRRLMFNLYRIFTVSLMHQRVLSEVREERITVCRIHSAPMMCQPNLVKLEKAGVQSKRLEHWQRSVRQAI